MAEPGRPARPAQLDAWRIPDTVLADAYEAVSDIDRSWIKKNIAQLYALHAPPGTRRTSTQTHWSGGLTTFAVRLPRPWACLLSLQDGPGTFTGPAPLAAALVPVLTAGILDVMAILDPAALESAPLLACLELCGVEQILAVPLEAVPELLQTLAAEEPQGLILDLGGALPQNLRQAPELSISLAQTGFWRPRPIPALRLWSDPAVQWDWPVLAWNHPQARIEAWGPGRDAAPKRVIRVSGSWDEFCRADAAVLGVGAHQLQNPELPRTGLILTPGQEGCWYWPDLHPDPLCFQHGITLTAP